MEFPISRREMLTVRIYKGDKWAKIHGSTIPLGSPVEVLRFFPRRRVLIRFQDKNILTLLWCLKGVK